MRRKLPADDVQGEAGQTLAFGFSDADDRNEAGAVGGSCLALPRFDQDSPWSARRSEWPTMTALRRPRP